jgi:hypothetical protein
VVNVVSQARRVVGQAFGGAVTPTLGAGGGVSGTAPKVESGMWEEVLSGEFVRRVVAEIGPGTLLVDLDAMVERWTTHDFYKESEYDDLLQDLRRTGNWEWVKRLEEFKFRLRCAEEPIGYVVFWDDSEVVDVIMLVLFHEKHYVNLVVYRLGGGE